jgi:PAS domain S-box-containing protein
VLNKLAAESSTLERLSESEEKYRRLFEFSEDPMWLILNNKFEICNDAAVAVLGYSTQQELASTHPSALSPPHQSCGTDSFAKAEQMMTAALEKGYHRFEWIHRKKDGSDFPVEVTLTAIPYEGDIGIYCVWRDISERKNAEAELKEAKLAADEANLAKSKFLALMSHELRTPLNAVIGFSEFLSMEALGPLAEKQKEVVSNIHRGGSLLLNLVNDLLDFAKLESGQFDIDIGKVDILDAVDVAISMVEKDAASREITIHWDHDPDQPIWVYGDKLRLAQSIVNIFSNAIKYNEVGGNIWIRTSPGEGDVFQTISITDDGCGIDESQFQNIFEAFDRGDQKNSHVEGTGLGLNVTKRLLEAMGGSVTCESSVGIGTTFALHLPTNEAAT